VDALESATDWILANGKDRLADVLAGAVPFLYLLGTVVGGWQMGRAAQAARRRLAAGEGDAVYLNSLVDLARFYMATVAPQAQANARTVKYAGDPLTRFAEAAF
jgi:acyl-CoA dehydrogenase